MGQRGIVTLIAFAACAPLDREAPFRTPAYARAVDATEHALGSPHASANRGPYEAGWARARIEAPTGAPLAGYGARRGAASTGTRDPVYVRAFAIRAGPTMVLLYTADSLLVTPELAAEVRARLAPRLAGDRIFLTASHTHSGPGGFAQGFLYELVFGAFDRRAFEAIVHAFHEAGLRAIDGLRPAAIGSADLRVPGLAANRTEKEGPVDDRAFVIHFAHNDGGRAIFWSYGCHPVIFGADNLELSADYPGAVAKSLEGEGFEVVGFAAGGVGSANPRVDRIERIAEPLARAVRAQAETARKSADQVGSLNAVALEAPLPDPKYRVTRNVMVWPPLAEAMLETKSAPFGAIAIGDTVLVHLPVELSGELTMSARSEAKKRGVRLALLPFNGKWLGYVVSRRAYDLDERRGAALFEYETRVASFFGPYEGDLFMNLAMRLADGVNRRGADRH